MAIVSLYSVLWLALGGLLLLAVGLWRWRGIPAPARVGLWLLVATVALGAYVQFRPTEGALRIETLGQAEARIGNGSPTVLELYSEY